MKINPSGLAVVARKPSAIAPMIMSLLALIVSLLAIAAAADLPSDEGAAAHIWQLLMVGQVPILGWFAFHWLRRDLRTGAAVLGLQIAAFTAALLPVWLLGL